MARLQDADDIEFRQLTRTLNLAGIAAIGGIFGCAYFLAYRSLADADHAAEMRTTVVEQFLLQKSSITASHADARRRLRDHEMRLDELLKRIPSSPEEASFLAQLSELSNDAGVRIRHFDPGDTKEIGNYASLEIEVVAEASYQSLCRFLHGLTKLPRLSEVTALSIEDVDPAAYVYPVTLSLRIYFAHFQDADANPGEPDRA